MKLQDLFEHTVEENIIVVPRGTKHLNYHGMVVKGNFDAYGTNIASLEGSPSEVWGNYDCGNTDIASLHNVHKQIKYIGSTFYLTNKLESHILGVLFIKGLKEIVFVGPAIKKSVGGGGEFIDPPLQQVEKIINKHLKGDRNPHDAQQELIDAGLSEYAKL